MSEQERRCAGVTAEGAPCEVPSAMVLEDGYCIKHSSSPAMKALSAAASIRGGITTRARTKRGIDDDELPPLDRPEAAEVWAETIGRAVACGRLSGTAGSAALAALREWRAAHQDGRLRKRLEELEKKVKLRLLR